MKKTSLKSLRNKAWKLMSEYVRRKEKGICFSCGDKRNWKLQQAGHFIHKDCLDFDFNNIHCQCVKCNHFKSGNLGEYALAYLDFYGSDRGHAIMDELREAGYRVKKFSRSELESIIIGLNERLKLLNEKN